MGYHLDGSDLERSPTLSDRDGNTSAHCTVDVDLAALLKEDKEVRAGTIQRHLR